MPNHHRKNPSSTRRRFIQGCAESFAVVTTLGVSFSSLAAQERKKEARAETAPPKHPPLQSVDIADFPAGVERLDLFLLMGQSNMKGRGSMPDEPKHDPRIVMMHLKDDRWYLARHPLHLTGDAQTFMGADNAGVGSGLAFAERIVAADPKLRVGLIPCAVGGSQIALWQKGAKLYDEALRRAQLSLNQTKSVKARIRGALWLQGEADANEARLPVYESKLLKLIDDLRNDLASPELPFIACTIGEMKSDDGASNRSKLNELLLSLPKKRPRAACVDARELKGHIGDNVHFDTASQNEIGRRYAEQYLALTQ